MKVPDKQGTRGGLPRDATDSAALGEFYVEPAPSAVDAVHEAHIALHNALDIPKFIELPPIHEEVREEIDHALEALHRVDPQCHPDGPTPTPTQLGPFWLLKPAPLEIEFPSHDLAPGGYDASWQDRKCPRCHKIVSTVRSSEFGTEQEGYHAGSFKRGPVGACKCKPPTLYAVLAPDGRVSCATLLENAIGKSKEPDWKGSYIIEYEASFVLVSPPS